MASILNNQEKQDFRTEWLEASRIEEWNTFALTHRLGTVYHTGMWRAALERSFPHIQSRFVVLINNLTGQICGGLPLYTVKKRARSSLTAVPHATFCQPLFAAAPEPEALIAAITKLGQGTEASNIYLRWMESDYVRPSELKGTRYLHHTIALDHPLEKIWAKLSRTAVRRMVKNAEKRGITVCQATTVSELQQFHRLLSQTRQRLGLPATPYSFLRELWETLGIGHRSLLLARLDGKLIGGVLSTKGGRLYLLEHYGESAEARGSGVNSLLYWKAVCEAHAEGFSRFSFGRTGEDNEGLSTYKRHWGVEEETIIYHEIPLTGQTPSLHSKPASQYWMRTVLRNLPLPALPCGKQSILPILELIQMATAPNSLNNLAKKPAGFIEYFRSLDPFRRKPIITLGIFTVILVIAFIKPLLGLILHAAKTDLHSHILLIPAIAFYLLSVQSNELPKSFGRSILPAIISVIGGGLFLGLSSWLNTSYPGISINDRLAAIIPAFLCFLVAGGFWFLGTRWMWSAIFPVAFLVFMIPLPDAAVHALENASKVASAEAAGWFFELGGTPVVRNGLIFQLPNILIEVAQECSGIRSSWVLFITSLVAAHLFLKSPWRRLIIVALVIPLGVIRNGFRIFVIGTLCVNYGPHMIHHHIHKKGGPYFFIISLIPLFILLWWLCRRELRKLKDNSKVESELN